MPTDTSAYVASPALVAQMTIPHPMNQQIVREIGQWSPRARRRATPIE